MILGNVGATCVNSEHACAKEHPSRFVSINTISKLEVDANSIASNALGNILISLNVLAF